METRSRTRSGITFHPDPEPARVTLETSILRASSESSLNLTVLMDDGEAGVVGPGHPAVRATTTFQGTNLADQAIDTAGNDPVRESEYPSGSTSEGTVDYIISANIQHLWYSRRFSDVHLIDLTAGSDGCSYFGTIFALVPARISSAYM